jgi:DNA-binding MarR family transcriptional regulator
MNKMKKQLTIEFMRLNGLFLRYSMMKRVNKDINPNQGQGRVLSILKLQPEMEQKELGYLLDISKQALAELLSKLEKKGYITRTKSEKDRRSFLIKLTDDGREAISEENRIDDNYVEELFDCLDDDEQKNLINYFKRIIDTIEEKSRFDDSDDYASFFRERFFARHGHEHDMFRGAMGFNPHRFRGFRGMHDDR